MEWLLPMISSFMVSFSFWVLGGTRQAERDEAAKTAHKSRTSKRFTAIPPFLYHTTKKEKSEGIPSLFLKI